MTVPGPGWYIDPEDASHMRWWSGESWTEHKSPNPQYLPAAAPAVIELEEPQYVPMASYYGAAAGTGTGSGAGTAKLTHREKDRQIRRNNSFAYTGCVLSLVAFLFNPFAILSILGIVFSAIGLAKSHDLDGRHRVTGRGTAIAGIIIGLLGLAAFAWVLAQRLV
jgi:hypothetical protein